MPNSQRPELIADASCFSRIKGVVTIDVEIDCDPCDRRFKAVSVAVAVQILEFAPSDPAVGGVAKDDVGIFIAEVELHPIRSSRTKTSLRDFPNHIITRLHVGESGASAGVSYSRLFSCVEDAVVVGINVGRDACNARFICRGCRFVTTVGVLIVVFEDRDVGERIPDSTAAWIDRNRGEEDCGFRVDRRERGRKVRRNDPLATCNCWICHYERQRSLLP